MNIRIDYDVLARACADLEVSVPDVTLAEKAPDSHKTLGQYSSLGVITLFLDAERPGGSVRMLTADLNRTFLHELRHHWQLTHNPDTWDDKPGTYYTKLSEIDARDWADENVNKYRIVRLAPRIGRSPLNQLSRAERNVRR